MPAKACGQVWARDFGVDVACVQHRQHHQQRQQRQQRYFLRLRYCLDASHAVHLLGTGVAEGEKKTMFKFEVFPGGRVRVHPARYAEVVRQCLCPQTLEELTRQLRRYVASFGKDLSGHLRLGPWKQNRA